MTICPQWGRSLSHDALEMVPMMQCDMLWKDQPRDTRGLAPRRIRIRNNRDFQEGPAREEFPSPRNYQSDKVTRFLLISRNTLYCADDSYIHFQALVAGSYLELES